MSLEPNCGSPLPPLVQGVRSLHESRHWLGRAGDLGVFPLNGQPLGCMGNSGLVGNLGTLVPRIETKLEDTLAGSKHWHQELTSTEMSSREGPKYM